MIERLPEDRHWWFASRTRAIESLLDPYLPSQAVDGYRSPIEVLDVGCGAGNMTHHLSQYGEVTGFDPFASPLQIAVERGYRVLQADAASLPFLTGAFDLVAALDVVEHTPDDLRAFDELRRVTRPGGLLLVTVPAFDWLWTYNDTVNRHYRRYTAGQLRDRLTSAGFRVLRLTFNNCFIFPVVAPLLKARGTKPPRTVSAPLTDGAYQVEMEPASPAVNTVLSAIGRLEAACIRHLDLPVGTSLLCLAERPA